MSGLCRTNEFAVTPHTTVLEAAQRTNTPVAALQTAIDPKTLDLISGDVARRLRVLPLSVEGSRLHIAVRAGTEDDVSPTIAFLTGLEIETVATEPAVLDQAIAAAYRRTEDVIVENAVPQRTDINESAAPIVRFVEEIIREGVRRNASDIHLEPLPRRMRIRYRIDGELLEVESPPRNTEAAITSRIKLLAGMNLDERRRSQDGRLRINAENQRVDFRVSCIPATGGESLVLRVLDHRAANTGFAELGMSPEISRTLERLLALPDGLIVVTGPTGSGKTTTLYSCLKQLNQADRKIITVEDPIEYELHGINQVPVRNSIGMSFATALRAILRQAPNVIFIGEIRDRETAEIAVNAALTGHLVLSTLHTNDAPSAVTRLLDLGVKPFLLATALRASIAQRLVRRLCPACSEDDTAAATLLRNEMPSLENAAPRHHGAGCPRCSSTGYAGRFGIFETFTIDQATQNLIQSRPTIDALRAHARRCGAPTLRSDGLRNVASGLTSLSEVFAATINDADSQNEF